MREMNGKIRETIRPRGKWIARGTFSEHDRAALEARGYTLEPRPEPSTFAQAHVEALDDYERAALMGRR